MHFLQLIIMHMQRFKHNAHLIHSIFTFDNVIKEILPAITFKRSKYIPFIWNIFYIAHKLHTHCNVL